MRFSAYCNTDTTANRAGQTPRRPSTGNQPANSSSTNRSCNRSRITIAGVPFGLAAHATRAVSTGTTEPEPRPIDIRQPSTETLTTPAATRTKRSNSQDHQHINSVINKTDLDGKCWRGFGWACSAWHGTTGGVSRAWHATTRWVSSVWHAHAARAAACVDRAWTLWNATGSLPGGQILPSPAW